MIVTATVTANLRTQIHPYLQSPLEVTVKDIERLNSCLQYTVMWCEENQKRKQFISLMHACIQEKKSVLELPLIILCQTR